ncbi:hypothetical protein ACXAT3_002714 [Clostridium sporogenes]
MATSFQRIYDKFLAQIDDTDLLKLENEEIESFLFNYLENSIVDFKKCKKDLIKNLNKEKQQFEIELDLEEIYILSLGMVLHWLQPQVQRLQLIRQSLGDRDFKLSSNWQTLDKLNNLEEKTRKNLKNYIISYTFNDLKYR